MKEYKIVPALGFDFLTPFYDFFSNFFGFGNSLRKKFIEKIKLAGDEKILDIGCGTGSLAIVLKKKYPAIKIFGIDPDPKILKIAKKKAKRENLKVEFIDARGEKLPFKKDSFDTVVSSLTFHHIPKEAKVEAIKEVHRVLKQGGNFYILDFLKVQKSLFWKIAHIFEEWDYLKKNPEIVDILKAYGFGNLELKEGLPWGLGILSGRKI